MFKTIVRCPVFYSRSYISAVPTRTIQLSSPHRDKRGTFFFGDAEYAREFVSRLTVQDQNLLLQELKVEVEKNQLSGQAGGEPPSFADLRALGIAEAFPYIGFGFLDNLIMILAGDYIDLTIGVTFNISTMAAAGLGNALSDGAGLGLAYYVERVVHVFGVRKPNLTSRQKKMPRTRRAVQFARACGLIFGCIIGMFPLLFIPHKEDKSKH